MDTEVTLLLHWGRKYQPAEYFSRRIAIAFVLELYNINRQMWGGTKYRQMVPANMLHISWLNVSIIVIYLKERD